MRPSRRSCRSPRTRKQCTLDELKQAPLRRRQPGRHGWQRRPRTAGRNVMLSTPWVHNSAQPAKDTVTCPWTVPRARASAKASTTSERTRVHTGGGSFSGRNQTFTECDAVKTALVRTFFPHALEIAQPNFTRKDTAADGTLRTLS